MPPKKTYDDKYYIGFWNGRELFAIMDLITLNRFEDTGLEYKNPGYTVLVLQKELGD